MKYITYVTEKRINTLKKLEEKTDQQKLAIEIWDKIFSGYGYYGGTLRELENYLGHKLDNKIQISVYYYKGIHGLEYETGNNVRYVGTHDLSYVNIEDFNKWIREITE